MITLHACSALISKNPKRTMQNTGVSDLGLREAIVGDVLKHSSICTARTLVGCTDELMSALVPGARCLVVQACGYTCQFSCIVRYNRACILPATRRTRRGQRWTAGWQLSRERRWFCRRSSSRHRGWCTCHVDRLAKFNITIFLVFVTSSIVVRLAIDIHKHKLRIQRVGIVIRNNLVSSKCFVDSKPKPSCRRIILYPVSVNDGCKSLRTRCGCGGCDRCSCG